MGCYNIIVVLIPVEEIRRVLLYRNVFIMSTVLLFQYYYYCGNRIVVVVVVVVVELTTSRFSSSSFDIYCLLLSFGIFSYSNYEQIRPDR